MNSKDNSESSNAPSTSKKYFLCQVCSAKSRTRNINAKICRACAAFYKRAVTSTADYCCKYDNNCEVTNIHGRDVFKACTFRLCKRAGAVVDINYFNNTQRETKSLLERAKEEFDDYLETERKIFFAQHQEMIFLDYSTLVVNKLDVESLRKTRFPYHSIRIIGRIFPPFKALSRDNKIKLLLSSHTEFIFYLQCYITTKYYNDINNPRFMLSYGYTIDTSLFDQNWYLESIKEGKEILLDHLKTFEVCFVEMKKCMANFKSLMMTENDVICLALLSLTKHAEVLDLLTPEILDFKDKVFLEWSNELQTEMAEQAGNHITKVILFYQKIDNVMLHCKNFLLTMETLNKTPEKDHEIDLKKNLDKIKL